MKAAKILLIITWAFAMQTGAVVAQQFSVKNYTFTVKGTSSLHDWESTVETMESKGSISVTNKSLADVSNVVVKIPVKSIKSPKGKLMDNKTWEAFNHEKNPFIVFTLTSEKINREKNTLDVTGTLAMAGVTKPIELTLGYKVLPEGLVQITGSKKLKMTDYKIDPPTAMMGTIKVGDAVEVSFEIILTFDTETAMNNK